MNNTILEITNSLFDLQVPRGGAKVSLKKKNYGEEDINDAINEVYGEVVKAKADWNARVLRLRELVNENKSQADMAKIVVEEGLFGGMATAKQCMPYIKMAQEWARQELEA